MTAVLTNPNVAPQPDPEPREREFGLVPKGEARLSLGGLTSWIYGRRVDRLFNAVDSGHLGFRHSLGRIAAARLGEVLPSSVADNTEPFVDGVSEKFDLQQGIHEALHEAVHEGLPPASRRDRRLARRVAGMTRSVKDKRAQVEQSLHDRAFINMVEDMKGGNVPVTKPWIRHQKALAQYLVDTGRIDQEHADEAVAELGHMKSKPVHTHYRELDAGERTETPMTTQTRWNRWSGNFTRRRIDKLTGQGAIDRRVKKVRRSLTHLQTAHHGWEEGDAALRRQIEYTKKDLADAKKAGKKAWKGVRIAGKYGWRATKATGRGARAASRGLARGSRIAYQKAAEFNDRHGDRGTTIPLKS